MANEEILRVFNKDYKYLGVNASRKSCHQKGLYHETFQTFLLSKISYSGLIYLSRRSSKKNYPHTYEATAGGHILQNERIKSGVRELEEELGLKVKFKELIKVGVTHATNQPNHSPEKGLVNEFANIFMLPYDGAIEKIDFDRNEIEGIISLPVSSFIALLDGKLPLTIGTYFDGEKTSIEQLSMNHLTPTGKNYWDYLSSKLKIALR
jgi:isopentenyldiphosphate isomerase